MEEAALLRVAGLMRLREAGIQFGRSLEFFSCGVVIPFSVERQS
jgi:hypothetical protein